MKTKKTKKPAAGTLAALGILKFLATLPEVPGFSTVLGDAEVNWITKERAPTLTLTGEGITIVVTFGDPRSEWGAADGSTSFDTSNGRRTFDRIGVDSSFHFDGAATAGIFLATIAEQVSRVEAARARAATAIPVPGLGGAWTVQPEKRTEISALLRAGRSYSFRPSGFGRGNTVSVRRQSRYDKESPKAAEFFGVARLYYSEDDCD